MSFAVAPVTDLPPAAADQFPQGLQWQLEGVDVGDRDIDTVNFVAGATLGIEVDPTNPKRLIVTIPSGV
jgi:hypothetical protein